MLGKINVGVFHTSNDFSRAFLFVCPSNTTGTLQYPRGSSVHIGTVLCRRLPTASQASLRSNILSVLRLVKGFRPTSTGSGRGQVIFRGVSTVR